MTKKDLIPDEVEENKMYKRAKREAGEWSEPSRIAAKQPGWVCMDCGTLYGDGRGRLSAFHEDTCGVCHEVKDCTEARDFGYLDKGWYAHKRTGGRL